MSVTLALDIGGTIAAGLVDGGGALVHQAKLPTPDGNAEAVWTVVDTLVTEALAQFSGCVRGVGISSAGPIDLPTGTVSPINIVEWQRFPIVDRVVALTGAPVRLGGDGLCMALGERWRGAGRTRAGGPAGRDICGADGRCGQLAHGRASRATP